MDVWSALRDADISMTGETVTVLIRDRDTLSSQTKAAMSIQAKRPVCFIFDGVHGTEKQWWTNGFNHNPNGPATIKLDTTGSHETYTHSDGTEGNDHGPAYIHHVFNGQYREKWIQNGFTHRVGGPAIIEIDYNEAGHGHWSDWNSCYHLPNNYFPDAAIVKGITQMKKFWYRRDEQHNPDGWSEQVDLTGVERFEFAPPMSTIHTFAFKSRELYFRNEDGDIHRTDGPARIVLEDVKVIEKDGKVLATKFGNWRGEWYVHGKELNTLHMIQWARKHGITMWHDEPCFDKSAFANEEGEFCFLTDFVGEI